MAIMLWGPHSEKFETLHTGCWCVVIALSFPLGLLSGTMTTMDGSPSVGESVTYLLLMIPNFFLVGYAAAAMWRLVVMIVRPSSIDCSVR